jgi:hypothetical protein
MAKRDGQSENNDEQRTRHVATMGNLRRKAMLKLESDRPSKGTTLDSVATES